MQATPFLVSFPRLWWVNIDTEMEMQTRGFIATHPESTQRCPFTESLLCICALGTDSAVPLGLRKGGETLNYIPRVSVIVLFPRMVFLVILLKLGHMQEGPIKKVPPQTIFFFLLVFFSPFSAYEKAIWAIQMPAVVYGTSYNAKEQFGTAVFLLMRKM